MLIAAGGCAVCVLVVGLLYTASEAACGWFLGLLLIGFMLLDSAIRSFFLLRTGPDVVAYCIRVFMLLHTGPHVCSILVPVFFAFGSGCCCFLELILFLFVLLFFSYITLVFMLR